MQCPYCYEEPLRDAGNFSTGYNMEAMKTGLEKAGGRFSLFGGEPLLMPIVDVEEIFRWGLEKYGSNGVQTNGTLITNEHIELFKKYSVGVGISIDGPGELNDSRWMGSEVATREATQKSQHAIRRLCNAGIPPSLIITLYRGNASPDRLPTLLDWLQDLEDLGVRNIGLHLLEVESPEVRAKMSLTDDDCVAALVTLLEFQKHGKVNFDLFADIVKLLMATDSGGTMCVWNACDPYTTRAVRGVDGLGDDVNCGRTNKDGVSWGKANEEGFERQIMLASTPQEDGGCQGCRYFFACKGQCPGTAIDGDWRNRTEQCRVWYRTFEHIERDLVHAGLRPVTIDSTSVGIEKALLTGWQSGVNMTITQALAVANGAPLPDKSSCNRDHGDHWDAPDGYNHTDGPTIVHGDNGVTHMHGDSPHGDSNGKV